jgi:hypothetical protein
MFANGTYTKTAALRSHYQPQVIATSAASPIWLPRKSQKPLFYTGGVINSGPAASQLLQPKSGRQIS